MQEEKNIYLANFEKQKEKMLLEQKRLVSSNTALVNQNDILKTTLESREIAWQRQVEILAEKGIVIKLLLSSLVRNSTQVDLVISQAKDSNYKTLK